PGVVVRDQPPLESGREGRLVTGRLIGRVAILGWLCTIATVVLSHHHAPAGTNGLIIAAIGIGYGIAWMRIRWDRRPMRAVHFELAMATLVAGAALVALDEQVIASVPFFCALAAVAGLATHGRFSGFAHIMLGVCTLLLAGLLAPGRMAGAS